MRQVSYFSPFIRDNLFYLQVLEADQANNSCKALWNYRILYKYIVSFLSIFQSPLFIFKTIRIGPRMLFALCTPFSPSIDHTVVGSYLSMWLFLLWACKLPQFIFTAPVQRATLVHVCWMIYLISELYCLHRKHSFLFCLPKLPLLLLFGGSREGSIT